MDFIVMVPEHSADYRQAQTYPPGRSSMDIIHVALWSSDIDRTRAFYIDGLGLTEQWSFTGDDGVENVYIGGEHGEIQFKYDPDKEVSIKHGSLDHVAISVDGVDAVVAHLTEQTDTIIETPPTTMTSIGVRVAFVTDPDSYVIELVEQLE